MFNRLPWIEEILRLVPGLYALWIFLWGGRVSPLVYWAPGSLVIDRPLVIVEAGAVIGMGAGLAGHAGTLAPDGIVSHRHRRAARRPRRHDGRALGPRPRRRARARRAAAGRTHDQAVHALGRQRAKRGIADRDGGDGDA